ncbi:MAG: DUF2062 domain-containing protein [Rhodospirillales bacterium]|nr:DUF2062 domain-containing protein [Rhodospirillales bacterium]
MAILKRRHPKKSHHKIRDAIWPRMGWRRLVQYNKYRLIRIQDTDRNIAVGLSWGAAVSFTPLMGAHILQALFFTWLMRGNLVAGALGTLWGNPWTLPLMQWFSYEVGKTLFRVLGASGFAKLPDGLGLRGFLVYVLEHPVDLFLPWLVGGILVGLAVWPFFYFFHLWVIRSARTARDKARQTARYHREQRLAESMLQGKGVQEAHASHRDRH